MAGGGKICCNSACSGTCVACKSNGACDFVPPNQDPKNECDVAPGSCNAGSCNGGGACAKFPQGYPCSGQCTGFDAAKMNYTLCDGAGFCNFMMPTQYTCFITNGCATPAQTCECGIPLDCPFGPAYYCKLNGSKSYCTPRALLGQPCSSNPNECLSNNCMNSMCVQGVASTGQFCTFDDECASNNCGGSNPPMTPGHCQ